MLVLCRKISLFIFRLRWNCIAVLEFRKGKDSSRLAIGFKIQKKFARTTTGNKIFVNEVKKVLQSSFYVTQFLKPNELKDQKTYWC